MVVTISSGIEKPRRSLLEVIDANFLAAGRKTYLHRLLYVGEHKFRDGAQIKQFFEQNIKKINEEYCDEPLTGFFLYYSSHFTHMVEGSEESISRHIINLVNSIYAGEKRLGMIKIVFLSNHISQRYYHHWVARTAKPPTLIDTLNPDSSAEECARQVEICITKMYRLAEFLQQQSVTTLRSTLDHLSEKATAYLPEYNLLDLMLEIKELPELTEYLETYASVPLITIYEERIWPTPVDFVPYDVFYKIPEAEPE